jgi:hypothetical protein
MYLQHFINSTPVNVKSKNTCHCQHFDHDYDAFVSLSLPSFITSFNFVYCATFTFEFQVMQARAKVEQSVWNENSAISSSTLLESAQALHLIDCPLLCFCKMFEIFS